MSFPAAPAYQQASLLCWHRHPPPFPRPHVQSSIPPGLCRMKIPDFGGDDSHCKNCKLAALPTSSSSSSQTPAASRRRKKL